MIFILLIAVVLIILAIALFFNLTPQRIADDILSVFNKKKTLRNRNQELNYKRKNSKITNALLYYKEALTTTGKEKQFALVITASLVLFVSGGLFSILLDNIFILPAMSLTLALLPFLFLQRTLNYYEKHIKNELETALSIVSTSYIRNNDILLSVKENLEYIKPPVKRIFQDFYIEAKTINANIKETLRRLSKKIDDEVFLEWCDCLEQCQDDNTLNSTLLSIVNKLTDIRIINNELITLMEEPKKEYWIMAALVIGNVPLLYVLNKDWFNTLLYTNPGKIVIALCGVVIFITMLFLYKFTRPIKYKI